MKNKIGIIIAGAIIGILSVASVKFGNPLNMGLCIACFIRDIAGGLGLHRAEVVQYIRPEVIGIILGAFIMSKASKEFNPKNGSSPFTRFILGFIVMIGALMFLGCPLRMILRLGGGDLNALFGILGFTVGIFAGVKILDKGFSLGRTYNASPLEASSISILSLVLLGILIFIPTLLIFSESGPGSMRAPWVFALIVGLASGIAAQKTRLCMVGGIRDMIMFKDSYLLTGFLSIFVFVLIGNMLTGQFKLGFIEQPVAHSDALWNFLGMALAGWGSVLLGGCPLRQLILAGEGNVDSAVTIMGMLVGAAFAHNFKLASAPTGPSLNGQVAVILGFIVLGCISYFYIEKEIKFKEVELKEGA